MYVVGVLGVRNCDIYIRAWTRCDFSKLLNKTMRLSDSRDGFGRGLVLDFIEHPRTTAFVGAIIYIHLHIYIITK